MSRPRQIRARRWLTLACGFSLVAFGLTSGSAASSILLKDGRRLQGKLAPLTALAEDPRSPKGETKVITMIDDDLRRVFVPPFRIARILEADTGEVKEKIGIEQNVARAGSAIHRVGPIVKITPFDDLGHRTFSMMTDKGKLDVIQGITQITPVWTKVEGLTTKRPIIWDMRIATSSIPNDRLKALLARRINPKNLDHRLRVVRLFLQMERYKEAQKELEGVIADFPGNAQLAEQVQALRQLQARKIVDEITVRRKAGQHIMAYRYLEEFPAKDVASETLQQVREMLEEYRENQKQLSDAHRDLTADIAKLNDSGWRSQSDALLKEMAKELGLNTRDRLSSYLRLRDDKTMGPEQRLSLAFSGWLLGGNQADANLAVTLSLAKIRALVRRYLTEPQVLERNTLLKELQTLEGASPALIAQLIAHMKPPLDTPAPSVATPGFYKLQIPGIDKEPDVTYYVQLPPQYDPHVHYPTIVTLNGSSTTPEQQIDWWAGAMDGEGNRLGQATRLGYIVIAVDWLKEGQQEYEFSAREHAGVLGSLRDACRRFSIDTDRVFLSGHSAGGTAAWDLGLAHPDLWAGVIPIVARTDKYCGLYWKNAKLVPFYFLGGEMDGDKTIKNATDLDRYMIGRYDVTVVEYQGRGHEDFYEDIQNVFDWISHREPRNFFPKEFTVSTMRTWDNYFWWLETSKMPDRAVVEPSDWPPARGVRPLEITGKVLATNGLRVNSGEIKVTFWLSPEVVDFNKHIDLLRNDKKTHHKYAPDLSVLLEDVRTRADRQHPFWAKVEL